MNVHKNCYLKKEKSAKLWWLLFSGIHIQVEAGPQAWGYTGCTCSWEREHTQALGQAAP